MRAVITNHRVVAMNAVVEELPVAATCSAHQLTTLLSAPESLPRHAAVTAAVLMTINLLRCHALPPYVRHPAHESPHTSTRARSEAENAGRAQQLPSVPLPTRSTPPSIALASDPSSCRA